MCVAVQWEQTNYVRELIILLFRIFPMNHLNRFITLAMNNSFKNCTESIPAVRNENRFVMIREQSWSVPKI